MLETTFTTPTGVLVLRDVMPTGDGRADLVRTAAVQRGLGPGAPRVGGALRLRPGPTVGDARSTCDGEEVIVATAGPDKLMLRGPRLPRAVDGHHADEFDLAGGRVA